MNKNELVKIIISYSPSPGHQQKNIIWTVIRKVKWVELHVIISCMVSVIAALCSGQRAGASVCGETTLV